PHSEGADDIAEPGNDQIEATECDHENYARAGAASEHAPPSAGPRGAKKIRHQSKEHDEAEYVATGISPFGEIGARSIDRPLGDELEPAGSRPDHGEREGPASPAPTQRHAGP